MLGKEHPMSKIKVVRIFRIGFEIEDGQVFPIDPSLMKDMTLDEFQKHYDFAASFVQSFPIVMAWK